jgi:ketosteroid isomerase-like protein
VSMTSEAERAIRSFVDAYVSCDFEAMRSLVSADVVAYVTSADGGVFQVLGRDAYLAAMPDLTGVRIEMTVTQSVAVSDDQALAMVEIRADREARTLHNFATFLVRAREGRLVEVWMVEAEPAYSAEFWA